MAIKRTEQDRLRNVALAIATDAYKAVGEDVVLWKSNGIAYPTVDADGNELWVQIVVSIPKGDRSGEAWDGYAEASAYAVKVENDRIKAQKKAEEKAKKIAKDKKAREEKAKAKAEEK